MSDKKMKSGLGGMAPTDDQVFEALKERANYSPTYYVRNVLVMTFGFPCTLKTAFVRRALVRLEKAGRVVRVPGNYAVMISWAIVAPVAN